MLRKVLAVLAAVSLINVCVALGAPPEPNTIILEREIEITEDAVNIRSGPGVDFPVTGRAYKGDVLRVVGMMGGFYITYAPDGSVGVVPAEMARVTKLGDVILPEGSDDSPGLTGDVEAETLFAMTNEERVKLGLHPFSWDERLNKTAQIKAEDMAKLGYFGHDSPDYGTPFQMLKRFGVAYRSASELIGKSGSVENIHLENMTRPARRAGVMSSRYGKMGVGVANSDEYGKITVQIFVEE